MGKHLRPSPKKQLEHLDRALSALQRGLSRDTPTDVHVLGGIHLFEVAFEQFWRAVQDGLRSIGCDVEGNPESVLATAMSRGWFDGHRDGLEMLAFRRRVQYQFEDIPPDTLGSIRDRYLPRMQAVRDRLGKQARAGLPAS